MKPAAVSKAFQLGNSQITFFNLFCLLILPTFFWLKFPLLFQGILEYLLLFAPFPLK